MSNNSTFGVVPHDCFNVTISVVGTVVIIGAKGALLIPLYIFILYHGFQQWRKQHSFTTVSHSDMFTYHLATFEFIWVFAAFIQRMFLSSPVTQLVWQFLFSMSLNGENFFQVLTCVERYLAVVHPIIYMRLRNARGARIRNISIVCVWLLTFVFSVLNIVFPHPVAPVPYTIPFMICVVAVTFCSISVLCALFRPGPGDGGKERVDQAKKKAFFTITAILLVLWFWFGGILVVYVLYYTSHLSMDIKCAFLIFAYVFNFPCGLVLPLLYLHRAGKLPLCFKNNN